MRPVIITLLLTSLLITGLIRPPTPTPTLGVTTAVEYFRTEAPVFSLHCTDLHTAIQKMDLHDGRSVAAVRRQLIECRASWKRIESFLEYFFRSSSRIYNRAPKFEAEEPGMEYQSPLGLQVIETLLYETNTPDRKKLLLEQSAAVAGSASDLLSLLYDFHADDRQVLESLRIQLVRIIALGITGYDAPDLRTGIAESAESLRSIKQQLAPYGPSDSLEYYLDSSIGFCDAHKDFDSFDRLRFLKYLALPLQRELGGFIREKGLEINTNKVLNYAAQDIFRQDAIKVGGEVRADSVEVREGRVEAREALVEVGKRFFYDRRLSGNGHRSCATCHAPEKKFTDGLTTPLAFDGHGHLERNAPSLLYSAYQYRQFWDGRAATLEEQIATVLHDPKEMHSACTDITPVARAIAAYVRTLHPMSSAFDRYITGGPDSLLTVRQTRGANLFMGRAQCATCHFMPLFNGLIPPDYAVTEFEVLGTTRTDKFDKPQLSKDPGRYNVYPFPFYRGAFKTPTVRNSAVTGPYMHNGAFRSLKTVLEFYNKGGGQGLGLNMPSQTLSAHPLKLSPSEIQDIIAFLHALTDLP